MSSHARSPLFPLAQFAVAIAMFGDAHAAVSADRPQHPPMTAEQLAPYLPDGATIETRLDADLTGDGLADLAVVASNDDVRVLKIMIAYAGEFDMGFDPVGEMKMGVGPLGAASLSVKKGVLLVEDIEGGTTAIQSLYRFRFDPKETKMRLIGDDVTLYSRTNAHDSTSISTNRLTGAQVLKRSVVNEDGYTDQPEQKKKVGTAPIWMDDAPLPEDTLGFGE